jgi:hypothetical protein
MHLCADRAGSSDQREVGLRSIDSIRGMAVIIRLVWVGKTKNG